MCVCMCVCGGGWGGGVGHVGPPVSFLMLLLTRKYGNIYYLLIKHELQLPDPHCFIVKDFIFIFLLMPTDIISK